MGGYARRPPLTATTIPSVEKHATAHAAYPGLVPRHQATHANGPGAPTIPAASKQADRFALCWAP